MKKRGEITVFLSLTLVCILSLFMGLLESARTAGARLYLTMAANSAMASVMSQYNRNLWDMYHCSWSMSLQRPLGVPSIRIWIFIWNRRTCIR